MIDELLQKTLGVLVKRAEFMVAVLPYICKIQLVRIKHGSLDANVTR